MKMSPEKESLICLDAFSLVRRCGSSCSVLWSLRFIVPSRMHACALSAQNTDAEKVWVKKQYNPDISSVSPDKRYREAGDPFVISLRLLFGVEMVALRFADDVLCSAGCTIATRAIRDQEILPRCVFCSYEAFRVSLQPLQTRLMCGSSR